MAASLSHVCMGEGISDWQFTSSTHVRKGQSKSYDSHEMISHNLMRDLACMWSSHKVRPTRAAPPDNFLKSAPQSLSATLNYKDHKI